MIKNVDNIIMVRVSEPIFQVTENANELDITYVDNTSLKFYKEGYPDLDRDGKPNIYAYHIKLMTKVSETSASKRKKLIDYQINIHMDPLKWLYEVEDLLNQNYYQFDERSNFQEAYEDILQIIAEKISELENPSYIKNTNEQKVKFDSYSKYLKLFDYNYLAHPSILFYYNDLREKREQVNQEILDNLINLSNEDKKAYFEKMKFEINNILRNSSDKTKEINEFQIKYDSKDFDIYKSIFAENRLYQILSFPENIIDIDHPSESENEIMEIRFAYYNFYYSESLSELLKFIGEQEKIYFSGLNIQSNKPEIIWKKYDTDLLELITALMESGSINNKTMNLTRKDAIKIFESFFNISIKDAESKLSRATARKKDPSPFLNTLIKAFREYTEKKLE